MVGLNACGVVGWSGGGGELRVCRPYRGLRQGIEMSELTHPAPIKSLMSYMSSELLHSYYSIKNLVFTFEPS